MAVLRMRRTNMGASASSTSEVLSSQRLYGSSNWCYWWKQALVQAGWVVYYSSDGLNTSASDLWATSSFQALPMHVWGNGATTTGTVDGIWICLRSPEVDANGDYLHLCISPRLSTWADPVARGPDSGQTYYVSNTVTMFNGYYFGSVLMGLALSSSTTAFSGGAPAVTGSTSTVLGSLPTATGVVWTAKSLGQGRTANSASVLTVLTEGNQFHVITSYNGAPYYYSYLYRYFFSIVAMPGGGYAVVEEGKGHTATTVGTFGYARGDLIGGYWWPSVDSAAYLSFRYQCGGYRSVFIKRVDASTIIGGGIDNPTPRGFEATVVQPYVTGQTIYPTATYLRVSSVENPAHVNIGSMGNFLLQGDTPLSNLDRVIGADPADVWIAFRNYQSVYLLKWDPTDYPENMVVVLPPGS